MNKKKRVDEGRWLALKETPPNAKNDKEVENG